MAAEAEKIQRVLIQPETDGDMGVPGFTEAANTTTTGDRDAERRRHLDESMKEYGCTWDGIDDPNGPYNWSSIRKLTIGVIFSIGQLVTLMSVSMMAAAPGDISYDLGIDASTTKSRSQPTSWAWALLHSSFLIAPISGMAGRKYILAVCNCWYIFWNALYPVNKSVGLMIVGTFMTGTGTAVGVTLTDPVMADMYRAEDCGKSLAIASFLPYFGPAIGSIVGGLLTQQVGWPWLFWTVSIFNSEVTVLGIAYIRESYTAVLLRRKAASSRLVKAHLETVQPQLQPPWTVAMRRDFFPRLSVYLLRSVRLLVKRPVIQVISLVLALNFGVCSPHLLRVGSTVTTNPKPSVACTTFPSPLAPP
ncbi:major facilitator superfamily domain-containing protein [Biscogniauxia marginata]|nr:major facilitator superfamily domain-containing protein [Biscogniauxia marginata]